MYVRPDRVGRGLGARLLQEVEAAARAAALPRLQLKASLNSVPFYQARGYAVDEMTFVLLAGGVRLPCASMHKDLGV